MIKLCKDCEYYKDSRVFGWDRCYHPSHGTNLVNGSADSKDANINRIDLPGYCGPDGVLWSPIQVKPSWWKRIFK